MDNNAFRVDGQTALVTGGASGLGLAITGCLAQAGATVVATGTRSAEQIGDVLAGLGPTVHYRPFDVINTAETDAFVAGIAAEFGPVSILVNNAGVHCKKPIDDMSVEDFTRVLNVHLVGSFALTRSVIPGMRQRGGGSIIFQASMTSFIGQPFVTGYATAKSGMLGMVRTLASECGPDNIRVNAIAPGWIDTPMLRQVIDNDPPRKAKILGRIPMNRTGVPDDIGMAALFLSSDAARYITGVCLPVDGGGLIGF